MITKTKVCVSINPALLKEVYRESKKNNISLSAGFSKIISAALERKKEEEKRRKGRRCITKNF